MSTRPGKPRRFKPGILCSLCVVTELEEHDAWRHGRCNQCQAAYAAGWTDGYKHAEAEGVMDHNPLPKNCSLEDWP